MECNFISLYLLQFFSMMSCRFQSTGYPSLVTLIPRYFILFFFFCNFFLIYFSASLLLVYRNPIDFFYIDFIPCNFNIFIISNIFLVESRYSFLYIKLCHPQIVTVLFFPFQFGCPLFLFFPNTVLDKRGKSGQYCLVPDF